MPETNRNLCTKVIALLKGLMIYNTWDRDRDDFSLHFYVSTFIRPPPSMNLQTPWLAPSSSLGLSDPPAGLLTLQQASWPSNWPFRSSGCPLDHPSGLTDPPAGLLTLLFTSQTIWLASQVELNKIKQNSSKFNKIQQSSTNFNYCVTNGRVGFV